MGQTVTGSKQSIGLIASGPHSRYTCHLAHERISASNRTNLTHYLKYECHDFYERTVYSNPGHSAFVCHELSCLVLSPRSHATTSQR
ncbi:hypothetical protein DTO282E5_850 [Paecilomyces variotii]|nr:hypothetical protein DTO282E5_850 [Paecilomyces variotii]